MSEFRRLGAIIEKERKRLWKTSPGLGLQTLWERAAGEDIASHTVIQSVRDGTVIIACDSGGWACELRLAAADLTARLNALGPPAAIREIRFVHQAQGGRKSRK